MTSDHACHETNTPLPPNEDAPPAPADPVSVTALAEKGLRLGLVDTSDRDAFARWLQCESRGFHDKTVDPARMTQMVEGLSYRRTVGVWDASAADPLSPVATASSWPAALTMPGGASCDAWAISAVTVSPTHRRRGIARALLEGELRAAHAQGCPIAVLTVSEATIYTRYGFAPTAMIANLSVDTKRISWAGPEAKGRVHFVSPDTLYADGRALVDAAHRATPGMIEMDDLHWRGALGLAGDPETAKSLRCVRYDDDRGTPTGFAVYRVDESSEDAGRTLEVSLLMALTDDASAGLWRFLIETDLVDTVTAPLRRVDEPLPWQLSDPRSVTKTVERDHLWSRILDIPAVLESRTYATAGTVELAVSDPLGFTAGTYLLVVDDAGRATVTSGDAGSQASAHRVRLSINELSAIASGGVSAVMLARAGRVHGASEAVDALDTLFRTPTAPWLGFWF